MTEKDALAVLTDEGLPIKERYEAIGALKFCGTEASVGALREALAWTDYRPARLGAIGALARIGSPAAIDALIASLAFSDTWSVDRAVLALMLRDERRAIPSLVSCLVERGEELGPVARCSILRALFTMPSPKALVPLTPFLRHPDRKTRRGAADAIGVIGGGAALATLASAAADLGRVRGVWASQWADRLRKTVEHSAPEGRAD